MMSSVDIGKKVVAIFLWLTLVNLSFYLLAQDVYTHSIYRGSLVLFSFFTCADLSIRPISAKEDAFNFSILAVLFVSVPVLLVLPFYENHFLTSKYLSETTLWFISLTGILLLVTGGCLSLVSRVQLGRYGSSKIVLEDGHALVTGGIYGRVRHPLYLAFLLLFLGFSLSFCSLGFTSLLIGGLFVVFKKRMDMEEHLLKSSFGEEYEAYMERTSRLIPYVY